MALGLLRRLGSRGSMSPAAACSPRPPPPPAQIAEQAAAGQRLEHLLGPFGIEHLFIRQPFLGLGPRPAAVIAATIRPVAAKMCGIFIVLFFQPGDGRWGKDALSPHWLLNAMVIWGTGCRAA